MGAGQDRGGPLGPGIYEHFPLLPVEDEGRLHDPALRENFPGTPLYHEALAGDRGFKGQTGASVEFHTRHKLLIMSHSPKHYSLLGKLVALVREMPLPEVYEQYQTSLMEALRLKSTVNKNVNVLHHVMGYFKTNLSPGEKAELLEIINNYRQGYIPLIVPVTLFNHFVRKYDQPYLKNQYYLDPHPLELKLRNHV